MIAIFCTITVGELYQVGEVYVEQHNFLKTLHN